MGAPVVVAKCKHCFYELEWKQVEDDMNRLGERRRCVTAVMEVFLTGTVISRELSDQRRRIPPPILVQESPVFQLS